MYKEMTPTPYFPTILCGRAGSTFCGAFRLGLILLCTSVVSATNSATRAASPTDESSIPLSEFRAERPDNFFVPHIDRDTPVCAAVLGSLNKGYSHQLSDDTWDTLIHNDFARQDWRRKEFFAPDPFVSGKVRKSYLSQLIIDLNNDGAVDAVYQLLGGSERVPYHILILSSPAKSDELSDEPLALGRFEEIWGEHPKNDVTSFPIARNEVAITGETTFPENLDLRWVGYQLQQVVFVGGRNYVLAADAIYWAVPNSDLPAPHLATVTVLSVESTRRVEVMCQFIGREPIVLDRE
jgi:hypothetical protein